LWQCIGLNGGTSASCSLAIPVVPAGTSSNEWSSGGGGGNSTTNVTSTTDQTANVTGTVQTEQGNGAAQTAEEAAGSRDSRNAGSLSSSIINYLIIFLLITSIAVSIALIIVMRRTKAARIKKEMFEQAAAKFNNLKHQEAIR